MDTSWKLDWSDSSTKNFNVFNTTEDNVTPLWISLTTLVKRNNNPTLQTVWYHLEINNSVQDTSQPYDNCMASLNQVLSQHIVKAWCLPHLHAGS